MRKVGFAICVIAVLIGLAMIAHAQNFQADNALSVSSQIIGSGAVTPIQVCKSPCKVYQIDAFNNTTSLSYVKLYNIATLATCGTGTPQWRGMVPYGASSAGGGFSLPWVNGDSYSLGMWMCITGGFLDADTSVPASTTLINIHFKTISQSNP